jgi:uncharacterized membrane protein YeaQ/YmgE (transglycosylase-associated protein family)
MELAINIGFGGWLLLIVASVVFGAIAQFVGETCFGYEWLVDAIAFGIGAIVASEFIVDWRAIEPVWDQVALVPGLVGGLVLGVVTELMTRFRTGGTYTTRHRPMAA